MTLVAVDETTRKAIWNGRIACQINLNLEDDLALAEALEAAGLDHADFHTIKVASLGLMANRCSYLTLLLPQLKVHFSRWLGKLSPSQSQSLLGTPWFSWDGKPLHWHHPIGLLFDLCSVQQKHSNQPSQMLPWSIQLNFKRPYPSFPVLLPFNDPDIVNNEGSDTRDSPASTITPAFSLPIQHYYYSSWKQAECLWWGSCRRSASLTKAAQCQIWDAVWTHNYGRFWQVNSPLVFDDPTAGPHPPTAITSKIPFRCYVIEKDPSGSLFKVTAKQWPVKASAGALIKDLLEQIGLGSKAAILHGLALHPETPLDWLVLNCAYQDNMLHLVVVNM